MLEKLWDDIRMIYEGLNFSSNILIDDLMIISEDNCYLLYYKQNEIQIRFEKDYNLVNMWSSDECISVEYKIWVEVNELKVVDESNKIKLTYDIITPLLREFKLKEIGVN